MRPRSSDTTISILDAETPASYLAEHYTEGADLESAIATAVAALGHGAKGDREIPVADLEVAVLDRTRKQPRKFRRIRTDRLEQMR